MLISSQPLLSFGKVQQDSVNITRRLEAMFWLPMASDNAKNFNNFKTSKKSVDLHP